MRELLEKLLAAQAEALTIEYHLRIAACSHPKGCPACASLRLRTLERFRDFRYTRIEVVTTLDNYRTGPRRYDGTDSLQHFVMNYPFDITEG